MIRKRIYLAPLCGLLFLMASCLRDYDYEYDDWLYSNAQISSFSLTCDSLTAVDSVIFTIDQVNGRIYNADSMAFGSVLNSKCIATMEFEIGAYSIQIMPEATGDTIVDTADSIDFSKPVIIIVTAYDGFTTKTYDARLNIHQVNPDSMVWLQRQDINITSPDYDIRFLKVLQFKEKNYFFTFEYNYNQAGLIICDTAFTQYSNNEALTGFPADALYEQTVGYEDSLYVLSEGGELFASADGLSWTPVSGAPPLKALMGVVEAGATGVRSVLSAVAEDGRFAAMNSDGEWQYGADAPADFPLRGFSSLNYDNMHYSRLVAAAGKDRNNACTGKVWSTMNGLYWASLTNTAAAFIAREGASLLRYDDKLFLFGGFDFTGRALKDIYSSEDGGVNWTEFPYPAPQDFPAGGYYSALVTYDNHILFFGGKTGLNSPVLSNYNDLWTARINRLGWLD